MRVEIKPGMYDSLVGKPFRDTDRTILGTIESVDYSFDQDEGAFVAEALVRVDRDSEQVNIPAGSYLRVRLPNEV